jgi:hemoglobin
MLLIKKTFAALVLSCLAAGAHADDSLFKALGGKPGIEKFTADFVQIVAADPRIERFFKDTDLQRLELLLAEQFCSLAGGPCKYQGRSMKEAHADMGVNTAHFNALAEGLQIAMEKNGVPHRAAARLVALLAPMHRDVVTK